MKRIFPEFRDDNDKIIIVAMLILSIFFVFIPPLLVLLCFKNYMSPSSYQIAKSFLNFELMLFLISLIFMIPVLGWLLGIFFCPILMIINIITIIINLGCIAKQNETKIPVFYEFI